MVRAGKKTILSLVLIYAALCVLRYLLALVSSNNPVTIPDEFLYYSMARSFAAGEGALFYGQQANYSFCLYPLLLSLAYHLPDGTDFYRVMQIISILVMNLSVFPIYALGKSILKDGRKSMALTVMAILLPDFILAQGNMSESLIYPLFFLMLWLASTGQKRELALAGVAGGILFAVKPGQIVTPIVLTAVTAVSTMRRSRRDGLRQLAAGLLLLAVTGAALLILNIYVINPGTTAFSMYDVQLSPDKKMPVMAFLRALALSPYTFVTAACILPVLIPVMHSSGYSREQRILLYASLISVAVLMLGSAWIINRTEPDNRTVHMRYTAMFIPVFLMLLAAAPENTEVKGKRIGFYVFAVLCVVPEIIFRYDGGTIAHSSMIFSYTLSWLYTISISLPESIAVTVLIAGVLCGAFFACRSLYGVRLKRFALILFAAVTLANNVCAYVYMTRINVFSEDAVRSTEEIRSAIGSKECVDVFADASTRFDSLLDVNTKESRSIVFINDLYNRTVGTSGVYEPFVPEEIRGDIPCRLTADTDLMLLDRDALTHVELSADTTVVAQNDLMTLIRIIPGKRWADSMLGGPVGTTLSAGTKAFFVSFDGGAHRALFADISSQTGEAGAEIAITTESGKSFSFTLSEGRNTYEIITGGDGTVGLCSDSDITIHSYRFD